MSYGEISAWGFLSILMLAALAGCGPSSSEHHWKQITELTGSRWEIYFVVTDASFANDRKAYQDAGDALCKIDICQIGFFATRNDVPNESDGRFFQ